MNILASRVFVVQVILKCKTVNYSLTQKVAETVALEQRLTTAECQNRAVTNKLHRHNELTQASKVSHITWIQYSNEF